MDTSPARTPAEVRAEMLATFTARKQRSVMAYEGIGAEGSKDNYIVYNEQGPVYYKFDPITGRAGICHPADATQFTLCRNARAAAHGIRNGGGNRADVMRLSLALETDIDMMDELIKQIEAASV